MALDAFYKGVRDMLVTQLGQGEFEQRERLAREVIPMLDQKLHDEMKAAEVLIKALTDQGLMSSPSPPIKQGYLQLQSQGDADIWKRQYFSLRSRFIEYGYTRKEQAAAAIDPRDKRKGIIALRFASVSAEVTTDPRTNEKHYGFIIHTPYLIYRMRAKHEVAMNEWLSVLTSKMRAKGAQASQPGGDGHELQQLSTLQLRSEEVKPIGTYGKPRVEYADHEGRRKTYKLEKPKTTVGRSSTNDLRLADKTVSRQHARFDYYADRQYVVVVDLGSGTGVKVNEETVAMRALMPGDRIMLGKLVLVFQAQ